MSEASPTSRIDRLEKDELVSSLDVFFNELNSKKPRHLTALALHLKVTRQDLLDYKGRHKTLVAHAKLLCQNDIVNKMLEGTIETRPALLILESDFGYSEKPGKKAARTISDVLDAMETKTPAGGISAASNE